MVTPRHSDIMRFSLPPQEPLNTSTKYLVALILAGLAAAEFVYHLSDNHMVICVDPGNKTEEAKAMLHLHLHSHR